MLKPSSPRRTLQDVDACLRDIDAAYAGFSGEHRRGRGGMSARSHLEILAAHGTRVSDAHVRMIGLLRSPPDGLERTRIDEIARRCELQSGEMAIQLGIANELCGIDAGNAASTMDRVGVLEQDLRAFRAANGAVLTDSQRRAILGGGHEFMREPWNHPCTDPAPVTRAAKWRRSHVAPSLASVDGAGVSALSLVVAGAFGLWTVIGWVVTPLVMVGEGASRLGRVTPGRFGFWAGLRLGRGASLSNWFGGVLLACQLVGLLRHRRALQVILCLYLLSVGMHLLGILPPDRA